MWKQFNTDSFVLVAVLERKELEVLDGKEDEEWQFVFKTRILSSDSEMMLRSLGKGQVCRGLLEAHLYFMKSSENLILLAKI